MARPDAIAVFANVADHLSVRHDGVKLSPIATEKDPNDKIKYNLRIFNVEHGFVSVELLLC